MTISYAIALENDAVAIAVTEDPVLVALNSSAVSYTNNDGTYNQKTLRFTYGYPSPVSIASIRGTVIKASVIIEEPFNVESVMSVGDSLDTQRLISGEFIDGTETGIFEFYPVVNYGSLTDISLFLTPGIGTIMGSGIVTIDWVIN